MTRFEALTLLIALLAVVPSVVALIRQSARRKRMDQLQDEQFRQNRATAALHEKELEQRQSSDSARVKLDLYHDGKHYRFRVTNVGSAQARNVQVKIIPGKEERDPIAGPDYDSKFPARFLDPGSSISVFAAIFLEDRTVGYDAVVTWEQPDGEKFKDRTYVTV
ncbi:hypothetical protein [Xanthomonas oryzae]|uniref:hypothetical protein n=1 Tax=Xanthomonas oryzae TaxID=347 RepID=UPI00047FF882|nr:hypothetical protein [Xanthomonas oryzae]AXM39446.1 hypothetical protein BRN51_07515 [Xanthomonas oryzae pv. oryzae]AZK88159.1 hypothetical protein BO993_15580 [Xanthomonas oryzae pv. oryzae]MDI9070082.1 hypothetical protein [Xanthomonas oryzae pv. oryzae]MDI9080499.1 hypothetical protein [Xanthomonas oryzae pv. oryzae]MDI9103061.1 hypothetical protein [Xanthomonas oryzae pv. oryzae]